MACKQGRYLIAYLDLTLPAKRRERLEQHLQTCAECQEELARLQRLDHLLANVDKAVAPRDLAPAVLLRARRELGSDRPVHRRAWTATFAAAAMCMGLLLLMWQTRSVSLAPVAPPVIATQPVLPSAERSPVTPTVASPVAAAPRVVEVLPSRDLAVTSPTPARRAAWPRTSAHRSIEPAFKVATSEALADATAARALTAARSYASSGDNDLTIAALENVAAAYPKSTHAANALLAAADLERQRGNMAEADATYRHVLDLPAHSRMSEALAHKALADMRRQNVGDDELAMFHYTQAAKALRAEAAAPRSPARHEALAALNDIEKTVNQPKKTALAENPERLNDDMSLLAELL